MPGRKEAGQPASEKVAESRDHFDTTDPSINPEPPKELVDQGHTEPARRAESNDADTDVHEADEPEIDTEELRRSLQAPTPMTVPKPG
jgi:hypothetical protein